MSYRVLNTPGKPPTFIKNRNIFTFPTIEPDVLNEMLTNTKEKMRWDKRFVDPRLIHQAEGEIIMYAKQAKPPVPVIS